MQPIHLTLSYLNLLQRSAKTSYSLAETLKQKGKFTFRRFVWERGFYSLTSACVSSALTQQAFVRCPLNHQRFMWHWKTHWQKYLQTENPNFLNIHHIAKTFSNRITKMWKVVCNSVQVEYYVCVLCSTDSFVECFCQENLTTKAATKSTARAKLTV